MTKLSIELPNGTELGRMEAAREAGREFLNRELGVQDITAARSTIPTLQKLLDKIGESEDLVWEPAGVLFGDILVHEAGFRWAFIDGDSWGRRLALVRQTSAGGTQIVNLMFKLFELASSDSPVDLQKMFDSYTSPSQGG